MPFSMHGDHEVLHDHEVGGMALGSGRILSGHNCWAVAFITHLCVVVVKKQCQNAMFDKLCVQGICLHPVFPKKLM